MVVSKGRFPGGRWSNHRDAESPVQIGDKKDGYPKPDGKYTFDKLSSVYITGNATRDDAPNHIRVRENVPREVAEAWAWMCPAGVYEIPEDAPAEGNVDVIVNYTNCVQCGAITAKGGRADTPEGGDGPLLPGDLSTRPRPATSGAARGCSLRSAMRRAALHRSRRRPRSRCPPARSAQAPPLRVKLSACQSGPAADERTATFVGSMPAVAGTTRMWMRFDLFERIAPATGFAAVKAPKLGVWQKSAPGRASSGFVFTQRVQGLTAPASFRAQVRFRWYGKGGKLLRSVTRTSAICKQPDQRPDLRAGALDAVRGPLPDQATYALDVRNDGRTAAAGSTSCSPSAAPSSRPSTLPASRRRRTTTVTFVAPRCAPGSTVRFELDAEDAVDESSEADDVVDRACPFT